MPSFLPFEGCLFLSDLDGTLLHNGREVPKRSVEAIARFKALGGRMSVATGRTEHSAVRFTSLFGPNAPAVLYNGAAVYDFGTKKFLHLDGLDDGVLPVINAVTRRFPEISVEVYTPQGIFLSGDVRFGLWHMEFEKMAYRIARPEEVPRPWIKVIFAGKEPLVDEVAPFIDGLDARGLGFTRSAPIFYEILPGGVTKGTAMRRIAAMLGVSMENTFAIGDFYNDLDLLRTAATSFTVRNAPEDVRSQVTAVVGTCEEGAVADAIEWIIARRAAPAGADTGTRQSGK